MRVFEELPDDDAFRVIKWLDRFTLPHAGTRSAAVEVLFQALAIKSLSELNRLSDASVRAIVGMHDGITYVHCRLLAGYIPHLRIGHVYRGRTYVGQLPGSRQHISLPHESVLTNATVGERLAPPAGWSGDLAYRPMTAKQYTIPFPRFMASKCLYFVEKANSTEYVIPCTVIFQTFYASHSLLANAFTSGPWVTTSKSLISEFDFRSGLKTQIDPETGFWDVVLTPHVPERDLAHMLALFRFDPYAAKCADGIYTAMLQDLEHNSDRVWYASAQVPFRLDGSTLELDVRGFDLQPRVLYARAGSAVPHHTFLVTSISSFPWPSWAPAVRCEKTNSGATGEKQTTDSRPRPYSRGPSSDPTSDVSLTSSADASLHFSELDAPEDRISIVGAPPLERIPKRSSIQYEGTARTTQSKAKTPTASSGNSSYRDDARQPIRHRTVVRNSIASFSGLLKALAELAEESATSSISYSVVQPEDPSQLAKVVGEVCWTFLNAEQRQGISPQSGWSTVHENGRSIPRTALILRITLQGQQGYWIEIEPRTANDAMCSPFLVALGGGLQNTIRSVLEEIAEKRGHHLQPPLEEVLTRHGGGQVRCFRHRYATTGHTVTWSASALKTFLINAFRRVKSRARNGSLQKAERRVAARP